jgi:pyruvate-formate lyase-activating enzyme
MRFECQKTENCFAASETWEYRLPETAEAFSARLDGWDVKENRRYRRPMMTADRGGVNIKGVLAGNVVRVSFPEDGWEAEKARFENWLSGEEAGNEQGAVGNQKRLPRVPAHGGRAADRGGGREHLPRKDLPGARGFFRAHLGGRRGGIPPLGPARPVGVRAAPEADGCPRDCGLCAGHETGGCCVLLELTNRCNLRCPVCFAGAGEREARDLPMEEIARQFDMLMARGGPFNIQLSGGEPTVRDDLPEIIRLGREKGFEFFQLNTNGIRLGEEPDYAAKLKNAGLDCVFMQFDGFDDRVFAALRGRQLLDVKVRAIDNCAAAGLGVVLVPVIARGVNDGSIGDLLLFAMERMPFVRGVHFQPLSRFGRCSLGAEAGDVTIPFMLREIERQTGGIMKAADFTGGGAENPYCSFHAAYMRTPGGLRALGHGGGCACVKPSQARDFVARQWSRDSGAPESADSGMEDTSSLDAFLPRPGTTPFPCPECCFRTRGIWIWTGSAAAISARPTARGAWCPSAPTISPTRRGEPFTESENFQSGYRRSAEIRPFPPDAGGYRGHTA